MKYIALFLLLFLLILLLSSSSVEPFNLLSGYWRWNSVAQRNECVNIADDTILEYADQCGPSPDNYMTSYCPTNNGQQCVSNIMRNRSFADISCEKDQMTQLTVPAYTSMSDCVAALDPCRSKSKDQCDADPSCYYCRTGPFRRCVTGNKSGPKDPTYSCERERTR